MIGYRDRDVVISPHWNYYEVICLKHETRNEVPVREIEKADKPFFGAMNMVKVLGLAQCSGCIYAQQLTTTRFPEGAEL